MQLCIKSTVPILFNLNCCASDRYKNDIVTFRWIHKRVTGTKYWLTGIKVDPEITDWKWGFDKKTCFTKIQNFFPEEKVCPSKLKPLFCSLSRSSSSQRSIFIQLKFLNIFLSSYTLLLELSQNNPNILSIFPSFYQFAKRAINARSIVLRGLLNNNVQIGFSLNKFKKQIKSVLPAEQDFIQKRNKRERFWNKY